MFQKVERLVIKVFQKLITLNYIQVNIQEATLITLHEVVFVETLIEKIFSYFIERSVEFSSGGNSKNMCQNFNEDYGFLKKPAGRLIIFKAKCNLSWRLIKQSGIGFT